METLIQMAQRTGLPAVSEKEARASLGRFITSHYRKTSPASHEGARFSIPADIARDDDLLLSRYIAESEAARTRLALALRTIQEIESFVAVFRLRDGAPEVDEALIRLVSPTRVEEPSALAVTEGAG